MIFSIIFALLTLPFRYINEKTGYKLMWHDFLLTVLAFFIGFIFDIYYFITLFILYK
jgi:uncharacterized membrane protein YqaE (UPF0057 family)